MTDTTAVPSIEVSIVALDDATVTISPSGTAYRVTLSRRQSDVALEVGHRVPVHVEATALRIHTAGGGGRFIEPTEGEPRIVAGHVRSIDRDAGTFVLRSILPMIVHAENADELASLTQGALVNFHVRSGASLVMDRG